MSNKNIKNKKYSKYPHLKKDHLVRLYRKMCGYYDSEGKEIPWRFVVWTAKYGTVPHKYWRTGVGVVTFLSPDELDTCKTWVCAPRSLHKHPKAHIIKKTYNSLIKRATLQRDIFYQENGNKYPKVRPNHKYALDEKTIS